MTAMVLGATVANRWFVQRRGLVLGMLTAANATGQLAFLPLAAWLAQSEGWRIAMVPGLLACGLSGLLMLLLALGAVPIMAQQVIVRPDSAESFALRGHPRLRQSAQEIEEQRALKRGSFSLRNTDFLF